MKQNDPRNTDWNVTLLGEVLLLGVLSKAIQGSPDRQWLKSLVDQDIFSESPLETSSAN